MGFTTVCGYWDSRAKTAQPPQLRLPQFRRSPGLTAPLEQASQRLCSMIPGNSGLWRKKRQSLNPFPPLLRASHITVLNLSFLFCKMGVTRNIGTWSHNERIGGLGQSKHSVNISPPPSKQRLHLQSHWTQGELRNYFTLLT